MSTGTGADSPVLWMTHDGKTAPLRAMPSDWSNPQFSPDGQRLAMDILNGNVDVWIYQWARDTLTRLTFDPAQIGTRFGLPMASALRSPPVVLREPITSIGSVPMEPVKSSD